MFEAKTPATPCALLIGKFDGIHLGHKYRIDRARALATPRGTVALITFSTHPAEFFHNRPQPKITTPSHKLSLLKEAGIDLIITLPFNSAIASQSAKHFLTQVKERLPFTSLILGINETLGSNREGNAKQIQALQTPLNFTIYYEEKIKQGARTISSTLIREQIQQGNLPLAAQLLGRPYSILSTLSKNKKIDTQGLILPPPGTYDVTVNSAPDTLHIDKTCTLKNSPQGTSHIIFNP